MRSASYYPSSMILDVCALIVSLASAGFAGSSVVYARRSARSSESAAQSAAITAGHDSDRRHTELTPRFRLTLQPANPGITTLKLLIYLLGPAELERLDALTVSIRDDHPWRGEGTPSAAGPAPEQVKRQVWGRWMFRSGTGPGADRTRGVPGADETGRTTPTGGMPVGEELPFFLDPTSPPSWSHQDLQAWQEQMGPYLRLRLECVREGQKPWMLTAEIMVDEEGVGYVEIPLALN